MFFEGQRCIECYSEDVFRLPSLSDIKKSESKQRTGKIVDDYIQKTKKEIKDYKKELKGEEL